MTQVGGYRLLDAGDGRRLERFGDRLVDRPAPVATWPRRDRDAWREADLRFDPEGGWRTDRGDLDRWPVTLGAVTLELRPTDSGGVGLFPEQLANAAWVEDQVAARTGRGRATRLLNLFAFTGLLTLAAAAAGARVAHVDASRPSVAWARRNAALSGLADRPVRWLVDDAEAFVGREARRGTVYDGLVLDPPTYGHGAHGRPWRLDDRLLPLLAACAAVAAPGAFVLLTAHTPEFDPPRLAGAVGTAFGSAARVEAVALDLEAVSGARLPLGAAARLAGRS